MGNIFRIICKECKGKCCKSTVHITRKEFDKLKQVRGNLQVTKDGALFRIDGKCPFLNEKTGCTLGGNLKPFDCTLYPLTFLYKDGKIKFYLNKTCPYANRIPEDWIKKTKRWTLEQLKEWAEDEKTSYSNVIKRYYSESDLTPV